MKKTILFLGYCLLGWGTSTLFAQEGTIASGGDATGTGGSSSFTIGQIDYKTSSSTEFSVAEGVQQAIEITEISGIEKTEITLSSSVSPNPTADYIKLSIENTDLSNLSYTLISIDGKISENQKIQNNNTNISLLNKVSGIYFLNVLDKNQSIKEFKIIKN